MSGGHLLQREADRLSRFRQGMVYLQLGTAGTSAATWLTTHEPRLVWAAFGSLAGAAVARRGAKRWAARARWYATTPDWADRIDEAPTVRLFPRFEGWFNAQTMSWFRVFRLLAVVFALTVLAVVFREEVAGILAIGGTR